MKPEDQLAARKVVMAGMKIMYDKKTFQTFMAGMKKNMPMPQKLATEAAGLVKMLQDKANGSIPRQVLIPAASMLLLEIAQFMTDAGMAEPTPEDLKAAKELLDPLMAKAFPNVKARTGGPVAPASAPPAAPPEQAPQPMPMQGGLIQNMQGGV